MTEQNISPRSLELLAEYTDWLRELLIATATEIAHRRQAKHIMAPDMTRGFAILKIRLTEKQ